MLAEDTSWSGGKHYAALFSDTRLWESMGHTFLILAIALPIELVLGLLMAQLFLEKMPLKQVFVVASHHPDRHLAHRCGLDPGG